MVESAGPEFDASAVKAVMKFVFEPAEIDGKPSPIRILYRYEFVLRVEQPTTAVFTGTIRDRKTKGPLSGVVIALDTQEKSVTAADGRFHFDSVPAGKHTVSNLGRQASSPTDRRAIRSGQAARRHVRRRAARRKCRTRRHRRCRDLIVARCKSKPCLRR